jgi:Phage tail lysozyme
MAYEYFNKWAPWMMEKLQADFKISLESSAAIVGNGGHESGGFKSLQEIKPMVAGSRGGYGVMQWTGPRRRLYEGYCQRNNLDPKDMKTNYAFLFVELTGAEGKDGRVIQKVEAAKSLEAKVDVFMKEFLRPGIPHLPERIVWAKRALNAWASYKPTEPVQPSPLPEPPKDHKPTVAPLPASKKTVWELILSIILKLLGVK